MTAGARVLVVDDRDVDRSLLTMLLGHHGYVVLGAASGIEALAVAAKHPLDLIVSDVLMPGMDGFEFARRLRQTDAGADVPLIFYTATYHEKEARELAERGGVVDVLQKPSEPEVILERVAAALDRGRRRIAPIADHTFDVEHVRVANATLLQKAREVEASELRLTALVELGRLFMEERDPAALLRRTAQTARALTAARHAVVGLVGDDPDQVSELVVTGGTASQDAGTTMHHRSVSPPPLARLVLQERRAVRDRVPAGAPRHADWYDALGAIIAVPLSSQGRVYGYIAVTSEPEGQAFSPADEQVIGTLAAQAGVAYDNVRLINRLESQARVLRENEAATDFALRTAGVGIAQRDLSTPFVDLSRSLADMLGFSTCRVDRQELFARMHPDDVDMLRGEPPIAAPRPGDFRFDVRMRGHDDEVRHFQIRGFITADVTGRPSRSFTVAVDMTERRLLEAQLRQAQKMEAIGQLAGGVAHDFNNLLTAILGYGSFLQASAVDDEQRGDAAEIVHAAQRAESLTRQLLAFSRRSPQRLSVFDANTLIADLVQMLKRLLGERIALTTSLAPAMPPVHADWGQIEQVLMNLVVNARDALPDGGRIDIATRGAEAAGRRWVEIVVADNGVGMTDETRAHIFEPFFTTKGIGKGTGLGLATVFGIVSQTGGTVEVETAPGQGATFVVRLPAAEGEIESLAPAPASEIGGHETVLLAEDDDAIRRLARRCLEGAGYTIVSTSTMAEALAAAPAAFDLLVTDVLMPDGTGPSLYATLAETRPGLRVLYVSGYAQDSVLDLRQLGPHAGFLDKPFTTETLTRKVREVLRQ